MKATAVIKWAPFCTRALAAAKAAKEHDEEAAPKTVASETLLTSAFPMWAESFSLGTKAWIIALIK